ncbi:hypothetical protein D3C72_1516130 [compost metagenome]
MHHNLKRPRPWCIKIGTEKLLPTRVTVIRSDHFVSVANHVQAALVRHVQLNACVRDHVALWSYKKARRTFWLFGFKEVQHFEQAVHSSKGCDV